MLRYTMIASGLALLAGCLSVDAASCDPAKIGFRASSLGFEYKTKLSSPLAEIISQGEGERLAALSIEVADLSAAQRTALRDEWRELVTQLFNGSLPDGFDGGNVLSLDFIRSVAPNMLKQLKECGPRADARLSYLQNVSLKLTAGTSE